MEDKPNHQCKVSWLLRYQARPKTSSRKPSTSSGKCTEHSKCFPTAVARCSATSSSPSFRVCLRPRRRSVCSGSRRRYAPSVLIPRQEDRPENSVRNGELLLAESVLQVVLCSGCFFFFFFYIIYAFPPIRYDALPISLRPTSPN